jgi:predicted kinase
MSALPAELGLATEGLQDLPLEAPPGRRHLVGLPSSEELEEADGQELSLVIALARSAISPFTEDVDWRRAYVPGWPARDTLLNPEGRALTRGVVLPPPLYLQQLAEYAGRTKGQIPDRLGALATQWLDTPVAEIPPQAQPEHDGQTEPLLIVVAGPSGAGKSTIAQRLADRYDLPLISKHAIKEALFDRLGWPESETKEEPARHHRRQAWSWDLSKASYGFMYESAARLLQAGESAVIEACFEPKYTTPAFDRLRQTCDFRSAQIQCNAEPEVLLSRFKSWSPNRSPVHMFTSEGSDSTFAWQIQEGLFDIDLASDVIPVDTTIWGKVNLDSLYKAVGARLHPDTAPAMH